MFIQMQAGSAAWNETFTLALPQCPGTLKGFSEWEITRMETTGCTDRVLYSTGMQSTGVPQIYFSSLVLNLWVNALWRSGQLSV